MNELIGKALGVLVLGIAWFLGTYAAFSFVFWDANIVGWDNLTRGIMAAIVIFGTALTAVGPPTR